MAVSSLGFGQCLAAISGSVNKGYGDEECGGERKKALAVVACSVFGKFLCIWVTVFASELATVTLSYCIANLLDTLGGPS